MTEQTSNPNISTSPPITVDVTAEPQVSDPVVDAAGNPIPPMGDEDLAETTSARPDWLDPKYATIEDQARAYGEAQALIGARTPETTLASVALQDVSSVATDAGITDEALQGYVAQYAADGKLSDEVYAELATKHNLDASRVNLLIAGERSRQETIVAGMYAAAGSQEDYEAAAAHAVASWTIEQRTAYNALLESNDVAQISLAVKGMAADWRAAKGPALVQGSPGQALSGYASEAEYMAALADPRWEADPAYRENLKRRLAMSKL